MGLYRLVDPGGVYSMNDATTQHARHPSRRPVRRLGRTSGGFTLIEAALATVIIGTGVLSILAAQLAYHQKNQWATKSGTAMLLANEIRELTLAMPLHDPIQGSHMGPETGEATISSYDDLDDFAGDVGADKKGSGTVFVSTDATWIPSGAKRMAGPIDALGQTITTMPGWSQLVRVENVLPENIAVSDDLTQPLGSTDVVRVTVDVYYQSPQDSEAHVFGTLSWIVTANNGS
jgi:hypothetical protein